MDGIVAHGRTIALGIGEVAIVRDRAEIIWTVLGSCVSIIFHVPGIISTACHAQMPSRDSNGSRCIDSCPNPCFLEFEESNELRYVTCAIEYMIFELKKYHVNPRFIHTTLVGGAMSIGRDTIEKTIGYKNLQMARAMLAKHGLTPDREYIGGVHGMSYRYFTDTNMLLCKSHSDHIEHEIPINVKKELE